MNQDLFKQLLKTIEKKVLRRSDHSLRDAGMLISKALLAGAEVRAGLVNAKAKLTIGPDASPEERAGAVASYREMLRRIERAIAKSSHKGLSLIDGSGATIELSDGSWSRRIGPLSLQSGSEGLGLLPADELHVIEGGLDQVRASLDQAVSKIDRMVAIYGADVQAIETRAGQQVSRESDGGSEAKSPTREIIEIVVVALAIALFVRSFLFQPFNIPSGSMKSTLLIGDYIFVSKYSYGYSSKSFPLGLPAFSGRVLFSEPERGDVIVFKKTEDGKTDYIKRLVGLPGDRLQMKGGVLHINGEAVKKEWVDEFFDEDVRNGSAAKSIKRYRETLPNGVEHTTLDDYADYDFDDTGVYIVPEGHYFMMGDNRDHSSDSRVPYGGVNFVPAENLVGRAEIIFLSVDGTAKIWQVWKWPMAIRYSRVFKKVK